MALLFTHWLTKKTPSRESFSALLSIWAMCNAGKCLPLDFIPDKEKEKKYILPLTHEHQTFSQQVFFWEVKPKPFQCRSKEISPLANFLVKHSLARKPIPPLCNINKRTQAMLVTLCWLKEHNNVYSFRIQLRRSRKKENRCLNRDHQVIPTKKFVNI